MKKRALSLLLALTMALVLLPVGAMAAQEGPVIIQLPDEVDGVIKDGDWNEPRFYEGLLQVYANNDGSLKWGFVDKTGKIVIPMEYDYIYDGFSGGVVVVEKNRKQGVIDTTGKVVIPLEYDEIKIRRPNDGTIIVRKGLSIGDTEYAVFDTAGKMVIPFKKDWSYLGFYGNVGIFSFLDREDFKTKYGLINREGEVILPAEYDTISYMGSGNDGAFVLVKKDENGKRLYGLAVDSGKIVLPAEYDSISYGTPIGADTGAYTAKKGSETQYFNGKGEKVSKPQGVANPKKTVKLQDYDAEYTGYFYNGLACWKSSEWDRFDSILIDETGKTVFPRGFKANHSGGVYEPNKMFTDGQMVRLTMETGETNEKGEKVTKDGLADMAGNVVVPFVFDYIYYPNDEAYAACRDGKCYIIDCTGMNLPLKNPTCTLLDPVEKLTAEPAWKPAEEPEAPAIPATGMALSATQAVKVDGNEVTFYAYALVDENGGVTNYVKLRDVAAILNGTKAQFAVGWNGAIDLETGKPYTMAGGELEQTFEGDQPYVVGASPVNMNGVPANLEAITLVDANGGNYNYFKLRDLGQALGFNVGWSAEKGVFIETK